MPGYDETESEVLVHPVGCWLNGMYDLVMIEYEEGAPNGGEDYSNINNCSPINQQLKL